jgi:Putative zinc-finger
MRDCESYETLISAWQDQELDRGGQVEMLDHLVRCAGCRDFYLAARGLSGLVAVLGASAVPAAPGTLERPSPKIWRRIRQAARSRKPLGGRVLAALGSPFRRPVWAAAAAAVFLAVLFVAVFTLAPSPAGGPLLSAPATAMAEIRIGGNPGGMDDRRFVEVARLVLGADRRYRTAFYEIMKQVVQDTDRDRPSPDLVPPRGEGSGRGEVPETVRGPS